MCLGVMPFEAVLQNVAGAYMNGLHVWLKCRSLMQVLRGEIWMIPMAAFRVHLSVYLYSRIHVVLFSCYSDHDRKLD